MLLVIHFSREKNYLYGTGGGVDEDAKKAFKLFKGLANLDDHSDKAASMFFLGLMYETGNAVAKDNAKALEWYATAANIGMVFAHVNLAAMYSEGTRHDKQRMRKAASHFIDATRLLREKVGHSEHQVEHSGHSRHA